MADAGIVPLPEYVQPAEVRPAPQSAPQPAMPSMFYPGPAGAVPSKRRGVWGGALGAVALAAIVALVLLIVFHAGTRRRRTLSRRLARRGWTVYLMQGCGYCTRQMRELGDYPRFVLLSAGPEHKIIGGEASLVSLDVRQISAFPYWHRRHGRSEDSRIGYQGHAALEEMAR